VCEGEGRGEGKGRLMGREGRGFLVSCQFITYIT